jgi:D-serine dehydratase
MGTVLALDEILNAPIPWGSKGLPISAALGRVKDAAHAGWHLFDESIVFPACVLKRTAIAHNRAVMKTFLHDSGARLAPHGKTTMAPQLLDLQLQDGAWALTAATAAHVMIYRSCGVQRIFYANELVDPAGIEYVLDELSKDATFEFFCLVDSVRGAEFLHAAAARRGMTRPLQVLIEIGMPGRRCGVRSGAEAVELAHAMKRFAPYLQLVGVEAFEGVAPTDATGGAQVQALLETMVECAAAVEADSGDPGQTLISAGGSAFIQLVASEMKTRGLQSQLLLRSGCYLTNDHGMYARAQSDTALRGTINFRSALEPALEVWGHVLSRPETNLAVVGVGKRDVSHDIEPPQPVLWAARGQYRPEPFHATVTGLNDQHACLKVEESHPLSVGDLVAFGCSHPCTTFDKWKFILAVDADYNVVDLIATYF